MLDTGARISILNERVLQTVLKSVDAKTIEKPFISKDLNKEKGYRVTKAIFTCHQGTNLGIVKKVRFFVVNFF
jgi:hypothetical protein